MASFTVSFMIITTNGMKLFKFDGCIEQQIDVLNLINDRQPIVWFDDTLHRKMYLYDEEMKKAINVFAEKYGNRNNYEPYELRKFMKRLEVDEPFYMFRMEHHLKYITQVQLSHAVYQLQAIKEGRKADELWNQVAEDMKALLNDYIIWTMGEEEVCIGDESDKRVCRFCGKTMADGARFTKKAHAISEALGNKTLLCSEECDCCNKRLAKIEDILSVAYLEINRSLFGIKGKKGVNSVAGQNFVLDANSHQMVFGDITRVKNLDNKTSVRLEGRNIFTFQGLYKALVKIVIDLVEGEYIHHFRNTIEWINGNLVATEFPPIKQMYCDAIHEQPIVELFIRKKSRGVEAGPYCFANLFVCDLCFQFVVPFVDDDCGKMKKAEQLAPFENKMGATTSIYHWKYEWIDGGNEEQRTKWMEIEYGLKTEDRPPKEINISNNLRMNPPKWEIDSFTFPKFNPSIIISSRVLCCDVLNINKSVAVTPEWLQDTSNNISCHLLVNEDLHKILVDISIGLCNTDNTIHLLDMRATRVYSIRKMEDVIRKDEDSCVSISSAFAQFVTLHTLVVLNPKLKEVHPLIDVRKIDIDMICKHYHCTYTVQ